MSSTTGRFFDAAKQAAGDAVRQTAQDRFGGEDSEAGFNLDKKDFPAARGEGSSAITRIESDRVSIAEAAETLSRSHFADGQEGPEHVITPMVMPKGRKLKSMLVVIVLIILGGIGSVVLFVFHIIAAVKAPDAYRRGEQPGFIFNIPLVK